MFDGLSSLMPLLATGLISALKDKAKVFEHLRYTAYLRCALAAVEIVRLGRETNQCGEALYNPEVSALLERMGFDPDWDAAFSDRNAVAGDFLDDNHCRSAAERLTKNFIERSGLCPLADRHLHLLLEGCYVYSRDASVWRLTMEDLANGKFDYSGPYPPNFPHGPFPMEGPAPENNPTTVQ